MTYISIAYAKGLVNTNPEQAAVDKFESQQAANPQPNSVNASDAPVEQGQKGQILKNSQA